ncbi:MAG TPA: cysteine desulfurase [Cyclobacteriaceae bacterium]|jgi:cysteine desulfurase/selenocysteine lyase|nr:cysteine desulfurase [Cyclobacteriaceae bacterium]
MTLSLKSIKSQFPIFSHRPELVYLDNAATSQKPQSVVKAITDFYEKENANVHRGLYNLSNAATKRYEEVREKVATLIGVANPKTIAFTKGTTESINIVAYSFLKKNLKKGDRVVITAMEHHANLIPWQQICKQVGATLSIIPVNADGELKLEKLDSLLDQNTKMVAVTHISNLLGTINPIEEIISAAHKKNIPVLIDTAQSAGHYPIDVKKWNVDFLVFSAHKMFGPMGTGVLYCKEEYSKQMDPLIYGGGSIRSVEFERTEFLDYPGNLEPGTPNVPGVIGLGSAIDFISQLDMNETIAHTKKLTTTFKDRLRSIDKIQIVGNPKNFGSIVSFNLASIHPHDVAGFLANENIAVRAGHHCAQPLHESLGVHATIRVSFSIYNTQEDVDKAIDALVSLKKFWS